MPCVCGSGEFTENVAPAGFTVFVVDVSKRVSRWCVQNVAAFFYPFGAQSLRRLEKADGASWCVPPSNLSVKKRSKYLASLSTSVLLFCSCSFLLGLLLWPAQQGIPGMILAVPMVVITRIVCDHLDHPYAKTLMRLLEGNVFEVRCPWLFG